MTTLVRFREPLRNVAMNAEGELVYAFDLPGIPEETIAVDLEESTLTVSGSRERTEMEEGRFFRYERPFGEFTRSVALPEGTGDGEAGAHYANGVLEVHVKKQIGRAHVGTPVTGK